jgi:hypothetical protein
LTTERDDSRTRRDIQAATGKDGQVVLTGPVTSEDQRQFTSTPRGAQNARRQAARRMEEWGFPPGVGRVVHGRPRRRRTRRERRTPRPRTGPRLLPPPTLDPAAGLVRIEVADAASTKSPPTAPLLPRLDEESGRGLLLVTALATRWGFTPRHPVGKTVWAEVAVDVPTSE